MLKNLFEINNIDFVIYLFFIFVCWVKLNMILEKYYKKDDYLLKCYNIFFYFMDS